MAIRAVLHLGDPGLREIGHPVSDPAGPEIRTLIRELAYRLAYCGRHQKRSSRRRRRTLHTAPFKVLPRSLPDVRR